MGTSEYELSRHVPQVLRRDPGRHPRIQRLRLRRVLRTDLQQQHERNGWAGVSLAPRLDRDLGHALPTSGGDRRMAVLGCGDARDPELESESGYRRDG